MESNNTQIEELLRNFYIGNMIDICMHKSDELSTGFLSNELTITFFHILQEKRKNALAKFFKEWIEKKNRNEIIIINDELFSNSKSIQQEYDERKNKQMNEVIRIVSNVNCHSIIGSIMDMEI